MNRFDFWKTENSLKMSFLPKKSRGIKFFKRGKSLLLRKMFVFKRKLRKILPNLANNWIKLAKTWLCWQTVSRPFWGKSAFKASWWKFWPNNNFEGKTRKLIIDLIRFNKIDGKWKIVGKSCESVENRENGKSCRCKNW